MVLYVDRLSLAYYRYTNENVQLHSSHNNSKQIKVGQLRRVQKVDRRSDSENVIDIFRSALWISEMDLNLTLCI